MTERSVFDKLNSLLLSFVSEAAQASAYTKWDDAFSRRTIRDIWADNAGPLRKKVGWKFTAEDLRTMSIDQLNTLGFRNWDDSGLRLIPLWVWNYIADGEELTSISKEKKLKIADESDLDTRGGCVAYGFVLHAPVEEIDVPKV